MANNSGMSFCCPPTYQRISSDMLCGLAASWNAGLAVGLALSEVWMWPLCPGQSFDHLAMNVAIRPLRCARILVKVLNSAPRSAASSASQYWMAASSTPGPVSVCRPSSGMRMPGAHAHELVIELRMHARAQHGVAEEARRQGCEVAKALFAHRLRRFLEHEEFEFGGGVHRVAQVVGLASTRRSVARGHTASAFSANSPRNMTMSPSKGTLRQVSGSTRTGASG